MDRIIRREGDIQDWVQAVAEEPKAAENAHILYLQALHQAQTDGLELDPFVRTKDADTIPFRAREILRSQLADWAQSHHPEVHYVPLQQEIQSLSGDGALSDSYFIDHLHFSHRGQLIVGRITADAVADATHARLGVHSGGWQPAEAFIPRMHYVPALDASVQISMNNLLQNPPFRDMRIPYQALSVRTSINNNPLLQDDELLDSLLTSPADDALQIIGEYLYTNERWEEFVDFLNALIHVNPGNYNAHLNIAEFLVSAGSTRPQILIAFQRAYLLSGRDTDVRQAMVEFAETAGLETELAQFFTHIGEH